MSRLKAAYTVTIGSSVHCDIHLNKKMIVRLYCGSCRFQDKQCHMMWEDELDG